MLFDVGVLLVPFEVGPVVRLLVVGPTVPLVGIAVGAVVLLPLAVGNNVVVGVLLLVVSVGEVPLVPLVGFGEFPAVTVSDSGLNIIHSEFSAN